MARESRARSQRALTEEGIMGEPRTSLPNGETPMKVTVWYDYI